MANILAKININFEVIESNSPKMLIVGDFSEWAQLYSKPAILKITLPDSIEISTHTWTKKALNSYTSINLGVSCLEGTPETYLDLPDGIYFLELIPSPSSYIFTRYYLKTDIFRLELDKIYVRSGMEYDLMNKSFREEMSVIEFLLRTAQAFARIGNIPKAKRDFEEAIKILNKYKECTDCI
jgi:hypothetical protein